MLFVLLRQQSGPAYDLSLSEFATEYGNYNVKSVLVEGDEIHGEFITAPKHSNGLLRFRTILPQGTGGQWEFMRWLLDHRRNPVVRASNNQNLLYQFVLPLVPWLLIFGFVWFFIFRRLRNARVPFANIYPGQR